MAERAVMDGPLKTHGSIRYLDPQFKGAATGVLLLFLLNPGLGFAEEDLAFYTNYSPPTLKRALHTLARFNLAHRVGERRVWILTAHVRQLDFSDVEAALGDEKIFSAEKIFFPPSSSSITPLEERNLLQTTTSAPDEKIFSSGCVAARLVEAGVFPEQAEQLAADPWVTAERVEAWIQRLQGDESVRCLAAVLYTNLRRHLEPGETATRCSQQGAQEDRRRFIGGRFADYIEH